jgi:hypothetical protein
MRGGHVADRAKSERTPTVSDQQLVLIVYLLYLAAYIFGITALVGVICAAPTRDEGGGGSSGCSGRTPAHPRDPPVRREFARECLRLASLILPDRSAYEWVRLADEQDDVSHLDEE